jgi:hypothetical protein
MRQRPREENLSPTQGVRVADQAFGHLQKTFDS